MREVRLTLLGALVAAALAVANIQLYADANCEKECGGGEDSTLTVRSGCNGEDEGGVCFVTGCDNTISGCGYSDPHNDSCFSWILCRPPI
jgi:hypothetical protein